MTAKFKELFDSYRNSFQQFQTTASGSSEYNNFERLFFEFYQKGAAEMKQEILSKLNSSLQKTNDSVPKTLYPSEKFKTAIKLIQAIET